MSSSPGLALVASRRDVSLADLASELRREVEAAEAVWRDAVGHAIRVGEILNEVKDRLKHGEFLPWVGAHFPGSARHAQTYMRMARECETVSHLPTLRQAIAATARPRAKTDLQELGARLERRIRDRPGEPWSRRWSARRAPLGAGPTPSPAHWDWEVALPAFREATRLAQSLEEPSANSPALRARAARAVESLRAEADRLSLLAPRAPNGRQAMTRPLAASPLGPRDGLTVPAAVPSPPIVSAGGAGLSLRKPRPSR